MKTTANNQVGGKGEDTEADEETEKDATEPEDDTREEG